MQGSFSFGFEIKISVSDLFSEGWFLKNSFLILTSFTFSFKGVLLLAKLAYKYS